MKISLNVSRSCNISLDDQMFDQIEVGPLLTCAALVVKYTTLEGESFVYANHLNSGNLNNSAKQHLETIAKNSQLGSIQAYYYTGHEDLDDSNTSDIDKINQSLNTQVTIQYNNTDGCPCANIYLDQTPIKIQFTDEKTDFGNDKSDILLDKFKPLPAIQTMSAEFNKQFNAELKDKLSHIILAQLKDIDANQVEMHSELSTLHEKLMQIDQPNINNLQHVLIDLEDTLQRFSLPVSEKMKIELLDAKLQLNLPFLPTQRPDNPHLFYQQENMHQTPNFQAENQKCI
ncbi:MAG: hypothetical protein EP298_02710 [Gammaproteobacteria bacterium]|nr:MAG: hypothetical protein EP298_02710 [Gammaproteobacteria bacterium]UTW43402.1 hypothetical protein KFE69_04725 [bacterium SCSIO 12844]